jgi:hypothetical protein
LVPPISPARTRFLEDIGFTHHEGHEEHEVRSLKYPKPSCPS